MPSVRLPDGTIRDFPEGMSREQIAAVLRREFPAPRPATLEPGETHRRNGASVSFSAPMGRYVVQDAAGTPRGFRLALDEAIDLADALLPPPPPRIQPRPALAPLMVRGSIEQDIERHIRQSEGNIRRAHRDSNIQRSARRSRRRG
jgi:hypothetical protein